MKLLIEDQGNLLEAGDLGLMTERLTKALKQTSAQKAVFTVKSRVRGGKTGVSFGPPTGEDELPASVQCGTGKAKFRGILSSSRVGVTQLLEELENAGGRGLKVVSGPKRNGRNGHAKSADKAPKAGGAKVKKAGTNGNGHTSISMKDPGTVEKIIGCFAGLSKPMPASAMAEAVVKGLGLGVPTNHLVFMFRPLIALGLIKPDPNVPKAYNLTGRALDGRKHETAEAAAPSDHSENGKYSDIQQKIIELEADDRRIGQLESEIEANRKQIAEIDALIAKNTDAIAKLSPSRTKLEHLRKELGLVKS